ncbi:MAG: LysM peptidoglycan-binding domain-containing protein [Microbacteriaceae bacterium]
MFQTVPIVLVGTMAMTMNLAGPVSPVEAKPAPKPKSETSDLGGAIRSAFAKPSTAAVAAIAAPAVKTAASVAVPRTYKVTPGDTVSAIAGRFGLSTASILALNGLGWKATIFPGQVLQLSKTGTTPAPKPDTAPVTTKKYTVVSGDTISSIATKHKVATTAVLKANGLGWSSVIFPGQKITIPTGSTVTPAPPKVTPPVTPTPPVDTTPPVAPPAPTPPAPTPPAPTPPVVPVNGTYVIKSGDTITTIAKRFGVTIAAVLSANNLTASSIIYAGRTLVIPNVATTTPSGNSSVTLISGEQETNALTIIRIGRELGVSDYGIVIALSAAMQESTLRNISYGHLDSVGLFQQRPSSGWGTVAQLTTPSHAARLFFGGLQNPNKGKTRGLLDYAGWHLLTVTQAAQKVQVSAYPDAYAKWEKSARFWLSELG